MQIAANRESVIRKTSTYAPVLSETKRSELKADTRDRPGLLSSEGQILDAAERQFGETGYARTTARAVAKEARANLGLIPYYFGSKLELYRAVCEQRLGPIMNERITRFDELMARRKPTVEDVVRASIEPSLLPLRNGLRTTVRTRKFYAQALMDPAEEAQAVTRAISAKAASRLNEALGAACPQLDAHELELRIGILKGATAHLLCKTTLLSAADGQMAKREQVDRLVFAMTSMLSAPATPPRGRDSSTDR